MMLLKPQNLDKPDPKIILRNTRRLNISNGYGEARIEMLHDCILRYPLSRLIDKLYLHYTVLFQEENDEPELPRSENSHYLTKERLQDTPIRRYHHHR